jgi:hypothetical protein
MKIPTMETEILDIIKTYSARGFRIVCIHADIQFKALKDRNRFPGIKVNICGRGEHIPEIERFIRVIKERARCYFAMLPFRTIPNIMVLHLIKTVMFYINAFVWRRGVSQILSPGAILEGETLDYNVHFPVIFGEHAHVYDGTDNTMKARTTGAIALGPSSNLQGGVRFFSLLTAKILHRSSKDYTLLMYPDGAIKRLNYICQRQKSVSGLCFADRANNADPNNIPCRTGVENEEDTAAAGVQHAEQIMVEEPTTIDDDSDTMNNNPFAPLADEDDDDDEDINDDTIVDETTGVTEDNTTVQDNTGVNPADAEDETVTENETTENEEEEPYVTRSGRTSQPYDWDKGTSLFLARDDLLIDNQSTPDVVRHVQPYYQDENLDRHLSDGIYYSEQFFTNDITVEETPVIECNDDSKIEGLSNEEMQLYAEALTWLDFTFDETHDMMFAAKQYSVNAGVKKYGSEGKESALKEIRNLCDNDCFGETSYEKLTQEQKDRALPILMFMVLKRNGDLKTRGVANGSVQRLYTNKEDVSSPTPDYLAFKYLCAVSAMEERNVATIDLPGFFLQTEQDELIMLRLTGSVAMLLVELDEKKWRKHLRKEDGRSVIYVTCKKAIYGTMNAALLAYKKLARLLKGWGFIMNPYEPCLWNRLVNQKQMSMLFHIDDIFLCHKSPVMVTLFIKKLEAEYGTLQALTVTRGLLHEYLGQTVDFRNKGEVAFSQYDCIRKLWDTIPDSWKGKKRNTAAPAYLFKDSEKEEDNIVLDDARQDDYHTITAKSLWLSQRSRPDLQLACGYHCTRIKKATEYDWSKLAHMLQYLWTWRFLPLIIKMINDQMVIYIDGAHMIHRDTKGHSGLFATMGKGAMISVAKKLGLVTISSTETEVVSTGERISKCTWFRYFRDAQGERISEDLLMQDNKSCILLQKNYPFSVKKGSKHIHVKYFLVTDKIERKELKVIHCPTDEMTADFNTKPLQGSKFVQFRNLLQGICVDDYDLYKRKYKETLETFDLFDANIENDLFD